VWAIDVINAAAASFDNLSSLSNKEISILKLREKIKCRKLQVSEYPCGQIGSLKAFAGFL